MANKRNPKLYDEVTEYNAKWQCFQCRRCGYEMLPEGGVFATPGSPEAKFASVMRCTNPRCGHALDILVPSWALEETRLADPMYGVRLFAVQAIEALVWQVAPVAAAMQAWESQPLDSYLVAPDGQMGFDLMALPKLEVKPAVSQQIAALEAKRVQKRKAIKQQAAQIKAKRNQPIRSNVREFALFTLVMIAGAVSFLSVVL